MAFTNESKKGFFLYASAFEAMKQLSDGEFRECIEKMANYAMNGVEERGSVPIIDVILTMAYPNLDASKRHHEWAIENGKKGAPYGKLGGRPRSGETKDDYDKRKALEKSAQKEQETPKKPLNNNTNVNINKDIDINTNTNVNTNDVEKNIYSISDFKKASKDNETESLYKVPQELKKEEIKQEARAEDKASVYSNTNKKDCESRCIGDRQEEVAPAPPAPRKERTTKMSIEDAMEKPRARDPLNRKPLTL